MSRFFVPFPEEKLSPTDSARATPEEMDMSSRPMYQYPTLIRQLHTGNNQALNTNFH